MEQLEASTNQGVEQQMPLCNLPSQIRCRVMNIQLRAEQETDEVYAPITLIPDPESSDAGGDQTPKSTPPAPKPKRKVHRFCKTLSPSDTGTHGSFHLPRQDADECFPPLDMSQESPTQELVAYDLHGKKWPFKHVFRGKPKRHLLTSGWKDFVREKKLGAGDSFIFLRGENGDLRVGVRRRIRQQSNMPPSLISQYNMHFGVIATASHAVSTGTMFTVVYKPRASQSEFIIPCDKYMEAVKSNITVGMRFKMRSEEEAPERRSTGNIIGINIENPRWPNSKWRSLKVEWDNQYVISRPDRVSPWEIEPFVAPQPITRDKRSRPDNITPQRTDSSILAPSKFIADFWGQRYPRLTPGDNECDSSQRGNILWGGKSNDGQADRMLPGGPDNWMPHRRESQFSGITEALNGGPFSGDIAEGIHNNIGDQEVGAMDPSTIRPQLRNSLPNFNFPYEMGRSSGDIELRQSINAQVSKFAAGDPPSAGLNVPFLSSSQWDSLEEQSTVEGDSIFAMLFQEEEDSNTRRREGGLELPIHHNNCGMDYWPLTKVAEPYVADDEQEIGNIFDDIPDRDWLFDIVSDGKDDVEIPQQVGTIEHIEHKEAAVGSALPVDVDRGNDG